MDTRVSILLLPWSHGVLSRCQNDPQVTALGRHHGLKGAAGRGRSTRDATSETRNPSKAKAGEKKSESQQHQASTEGVLRQDLPGRALFLHDQIGMV